MKNHSIKAVAALALAGTFATGCTLLKEVEYSCTPDPLEMHGDSVRVEVNIKFPEKSLNKKARAVFTPKLGSTELHPITVQGEKATGNGDVIQYKAGGSVTYTETVAYKADMETTFLTTTAKVYKGETLKDELEETNICPGCKVTPLLVNKDFKVILANDNFQRVTEENYMAQINYDKGRSVVKPGEMKQDDIKGYQAFLEEAQNNPKIELKTVNITGYASPEGEEDKNNTLSSDRAESGKEAAMKLAKAAKNEKAEGDVYALKGRGEDYDGFKRELEADSTMNEDDKQLVIRVLETISDPVKREEEMRNMGKTFTYLDKNIFPKLRRAEFNAVYDLTGFSDEELLANSKSNPDTLNLEELLFTATLVDDLNEKLRIYQIAEGRYAEDYRPANNVGAILYMQNKISEAKSEFEKANGIKENEISKNNLAAIAGVEGDRQKAADLLASAGGASEVSYNKGILNIQDGDYTSAVSNLGAEASFNKALAQLLNGNASAAVSTLNDSPDAETAQGYYLKAVAAARQENLTDIVSNLKSAIALDGSYKAKALGDREFFAYLENAAFTAIVK